MKDFNFFDSYGGSRKDLKKEYLYAVILSSGLVLMIFFTYAFNYFNISKLNLEIMDIKQNLNSKENVVNIKEIEDEDKKLAIINKYYGKIVSISDSINNNDFLGSEVMYKLNSCVPEGVHFKEMILDAGGVQFEAEGNDKEQVAVFERALRNLDIVKEVHVDVIESVSTESENFTFSAKCTLKDVDNNESN